MFSPCFRLEKSRVTGVRALPNLESAIAQLAEGLEIVAIRRLGNRDDARDAAQETIARLMERLRTGRLRSEAELVPIAWGIARHVITDILRERGRAPASLIEIAADAPGALELLASDEDVRVVRHALEQLAPADRSLLHRCFVDGEKIGAVAAALGEPAERVRKRKSRALQRLAAVLGVRNGHETAAGPMEGA
jgi:RNA polymerase sigma factor (sigma-70 family)